MSTVPPEELEARHSLVKRYQDSRTRIVLDEQIKGIRHAINLLIAEERRLIKESEALTPARATDGRGGA